MIDRTRLINSFFQVKKSKKYKCLGLGLNPEKTRDVEVLNSDILIKSTKGYFHRLNSVGVVNIDIPEKDLTKVNNPILFNNKIYKKGFLNS